ncbi:MAG: ferredoxin [Candidatus Altiarchaeota archaeon]|nr:ferredoxin [Candidatus Altiarchaeota archaeon]
MVKLSIVDDKCIGCGACVAIAPDLFKMNMDTMKSEVLKQPSAEELELAKQAESACPTQAIVITE